MQIDGNNNIQVNGNLNLNISGTFPVSQKVLKKLIKQELENLLIKKNNKRLTPRQKEDLLKKTCLIGSYDPEKTVSTHARY